VAVAKGQLRVLGSPSALRTKKPRIGGPPGGRGVRADPIFCVRKPLDTHLRALKAESGMWAPPRPSGMALATTARLARD
jgi:hypothetical protein